MLNDRSRLFRFKISFKDDKIESLEPISSCRLKNRFGKNFLLYQSDSEGITSRDGRIFISFEGRRPKILEYDKECNYKRTIYLAKELKESKNYRSKNRALESLVYTKRYGLLTSPERALKKTKEGYFGIYNYKGVLCSYGVDDPKSSIVEYESMSDGNILALFRRLHLIPFGFDISLKKIYIQKKECRVENIVTLKSSEGANIDNFEGLVRVGKRRFLMISDDNNNLFEKTLLIFFELTR
jgi:hypothetical protein